MNFAPAMRQAHPGGSSNVKTATRLRAMRRLPILAVALLAIGCSSHSGAVPAPVSPQVFQKQPFKNPWLITNVGRFSLPAALAVDRKGDIWVANRGISYVTRVSMNQGVTDLSISTNSTSIAVGSDKNLWLTLTHNFKDGVIARVTPSGVETDFTVTTPDNTLSGIIPGPDGALWFIETGNATGIGQIDARGNFTIYSPFGAPLTSGPDGNIWFPDGANMNAMNTQGQIVAQYPFTDFPTGSTVGPDEAMWFAANYYLYRVTTQGQISKYAVPADDDIQDITSYGGQLWMSGSTQSGAALLSFDPVSQKFGAPIQSPAELSRIVTGMDGNFWMTGPNAKLVTYVNQILSVMPTSLTLKTGKSGTLAVNETNYNGAWSAVWPSQIVNVVQNSPGVFTVTGVAPGSGKITIQDTMHNYTKIPVTVQ